MEQIDKDLYFAQALEAFFQFMDNADPEFRTHEDYEEYLALRQRIRDLTRQQRLEAAGGTTAPRAGGTR